METVNLRIANWEISEADKTCYSVSLKVPRKQELLTLLPHHLAKLQHNIKFSTGILATVGHSITLCIFREYNEPRVGIFVTVGKHPGKIIEVGMIDANYVAVDQANIEYSLSRGPCPKDFEIPTENIGVGTSANMTGNFNFWMSTGGWHDETAMIFLTFHVVSKYPPKIVNEEEEAFSHEINSSELGQLNISNLFLDEKYADIYFDCQSVQFPAHRVILSGQVKYFDTMLSTQMKESLEGVINMDDIDPSTCKELLRFIYQGKVENLSSCVTELYATADKYGMANLKGLCEKHLYSHLNYENALEVFDLCQMHDSSVLAKRAKEIIISNMGKFAPDSETLKTFTCKYPDLVLQLLKMNK